MWNQIRRINSSNKLVSKFVFEKDDAVAESVLYKYPTYADRTVICCSTQSGCPVGCRFCGAGDYFVRSFGSDEIVSQPVRLLEEVKKEEGTNVEDIERLQIMFMSMGEPLLNLINLGRACYELYDKYPNGALLISSIGPRINYESLYVLSENIKTIGLQFSVHESTDKRRDELIPFKAKLSLTEIADVGTQFFKRTGRKPFFNYCAHDGNSTYDDAKNLHGLFDPAIWNATISVICERQEHVAAANAKQRSLAETFEFTLQSFGYNTRTFDPAGQDDVGGGCGQLWFVQDWMRLNSHLARPSVGHGLPVIHTPTEQSTNER